MHANKKARTEDGRPVAAAGTSPPSTKSVAPAPKSDELQDVNLGDVGDWNALDHLSRLNLLRPIVVQKGRPTIPERFFFRHFPKAVFNPLSVTREAEMVNASKCAMTAVGAYFKIAEQADEVNKKRLKEQEDDERDEDDSLDGYGSSTDGDGFTTYT